VGRAVELTGAWSGLADALLVRAALTARLGWDRAPNPLAGYSLTDEEVDSLLRALPGLDREPPALLEDDVRKVLDDAEAAVEDARAEFHLSLADHGRFAAICHNAALDVAGAEVLAVLLAVEVDTRRQRLVGYLADDVTQRRLTIWTLRLVTGEEGVALVGPGGPLRQAGLLVPTGPGAWAAEPVAVPPTVCWWLAGDDGPDPALPPGTEVLEVPYAADAPSEPGRIVVSSGRDRVRRLQSVAAGLFRSSLLITPKPTGPDAWDALIRWATLTGAGVVVEIGTDDVLGCEGRDRIGRAWHLAWGVISRGDLAIADLPRRPWLEAPSGPEVASADEWAGAFGGTAPEGADAYRLSAEQLLHVSRASGAVGGDLAAAVRRLSGPVQGTATRIRPSRTWDDLVLDAGRRERVEEVAIRCRQRRRVFDNWGLAPQPSTGVVALFAGPSGTGKTLAAEVIAADLGVEVYKVDLANLVSKYIGDTEKNLSAVFDAAEASSVALFFDEADALLGKRSAVSDAHDRYANIEVAYLLQRLERYDGLAIMATNLLRNIDPAFLRRIHVIVEFPIPEAPERRRIWRRCLPPHAPLAEDLDLDVFADRVEMVGGAIRNAVATAAFLAAEYEEPIGQAHVMTAVQREMQKLGRLFDVGSIQTTPSAKGSSTSRPGRS
jgi:ATPase family associated with various cellular activities (AAA)